MRSAGTDFVIAAGTAIGLDRTGRGDGVHFVVVAVGPRFDPAQDGRWRRRAMPAGRGAAPSHAISLDGRSQNSLYSSLSMPRILS